MLFGSEIRLYLTWILVVTALALSKLAPVLYTEATEAGACEALQAEPLRVDRTRHSKVMRVVPWRNHVTIERDGRLEPLHCTSFFCGSKVYPHFVHLEARTGNIPEQGARCGHPTTSVYAVLELSTVKICFSINSTLRAVRELSEKVGFRE